jgi:hypothetical protein
MSEQDPYTRQARLGRALAAYLKSVATYPTPAAHHQLAIALSLPGCSQNVDEAIVSARAAVEGGADEIRHWHLLGLLLSASGEWEKAAGVLEVGADLDESKQDVESPARLGADNTADDIVVKAPMADGIQAKDFQLEHQHAPVNGHSTLPAAHIPPDDADGPTSEHKRLLDPDATTIPPFATLLRPLSDHPLPSPRDAFDYALQLRMTQMALAEHIEGPEGAEKRWVDVFGWIAECKGSPSTSGSMTETQRESRKQASLTIHPTSDCMELILSGCGLCGSARSSLDTGTGARTTRTSSVLHQPLQDPLSEKGCSANQHGSLGLSLGQQDLPSSELPPITVTPATPAEPHRHFPLNIDEKESLKGRRSSSADGTGRKVQQMLKARVHRGQEKISTISRKLGHGVVRHGNLKRTSSAPGKPFCCLTHHTFLHNLFQTSMLYYRTITTKRRQYTPAAGCVL